MQPPTKAVIAREPLIYRFSLDSVKTVGITNADIKNANTSSAKSVVTPVNKPINKMRTQTSNRRQMFFLPIIIDIPSRIFYKLLDPVPFKGVFPLSVKGP